MSAIPEARGCTRDTIPRALESFSPREAVQDRLAWQFVGGSGSFDIEVEADGTVGLVTLPPDVLRSPVYTVGGSVALVCLGIPKE